MIPRSFAPSIFVGLYVVLTCRVISENDPFLFRRLELLLPIPREAATSGNARNCLLRSCTSLFAAAVHSSNVIVHMPNLIDAAESNCNLRCALGRMHTSIWTTKREKQGKRGKQGEQQL